LVKLVLFTENYKKTTIKSPRKLQIDDFGIHPVAQRFIQLPLSINIENSQKLSHKFEKLSTV